MEERDLVILEDEVEALKLKVSSLEAQLEDQALFNLTLETINGCNSCWIFKRKTVLCSNLSSLHQEEYRARQEADEGKIAELVTKLSKMRNLCRENTRGEYPLI